MRTLLPPSRPTAARSPCGSSAPPGPAASGRWRSSPTPTGAPRTCGPPTPRCTSGRRRPRRRTSRSSGSSRPPATSGADAIHPGYGFLSERAEFARAVVEAGLTFVGPSADVMDAMGRKDRAREIAERAGVPVVPRVELVSTGSTDGRSDRRGHFPVLVKAASGGGGKGMRIVRDPADLDGALAAARREAASAFGDDTLLVERYVERGRHVEVQVLADSHGNVVHLFERDCSAQRRHQKVLEEAPAPGLSEAARRTLLDSAVALTREVGYENAGTVEFLVAGREGCRGGLLPRDEHPPPGRAPGHRARRRGGRRAAGPRRPPAARGRRRAAALHPGRRPLRRPRHRGARLRRGRLRRLPARRPAPPRSSAGRPRPASTRPSRAGRP